MRDTKAFASLTSGLLARKGQARPAMRPQGFAAGLAMTDDLGWNDMGFDVAPPRPGPRLPASLSSARPDAAFEPGAEPIAPPVVVQQQAEIAREFTPAEAAGPAPAPEPVAEAVPAPVVAITPIQPVKPVQPVARATGRKAAFTLRLDSDRHLRLRLACAVAGRSAQMLVTDALDQFLAGLPDVERLANSLPEAGAKPAR